jgi:hypothetical protein
MVHFDSVLLQPSYEISSLSVREYRPHQIGRVITQPKSHAGKESNSERPRDAMSKMEDVKRCLSGITPRPHLKITRVESELL